LLVETGKVSPDNLSLMLIRKHDWHDLEGVRYLLEHGADPNLDRTRGWYPLHHAIARDNDLEILEALLDHGADPALRADGRSAVAHAARRGRGDFLALLERRGVTLALEGLDRLIAACARRDAAAVAELVAREPALVDGLRAGGAARLAEFAGNDNAGGVGLLLDLGVDIEARYQGDGYWGVAGNSTALHVAAWRASHATVKLLIDRGAAVDPLDGQGRTPLALAVRACVDSYWSYRRSPESVAALLQAGAAVPAIAFPTGYDAVDELLRPRGGGGTPR
jgi:ankyrin repeat protein